LIDYWRLLSAEQQRALSGLREMVGRGEIGVVNEYLPNGYLRSYSVGLKTFELPEVIIYGLSEDAVAAFFDTYFESIREPDHVLPTSYLRAGDVSPKVVSRLVPLLQVMFPAGFQLTQIVWPDSNGMYPTQRGFDKRLEERQPRVWDRESLHDRLLPQRAMEEISPTS
jgi:hypothetical protein